MVSSASRVVCFLVASWVLGSATPASAVVAVKPLQEKELPSAPSSLDLLDGGAAMGDSEEFEAGSRAAGGAQGQSSLDLEAESEAGAHAHGEERSEASSASDAEESEKVNNAFDAFVVKHQRDYQRGSAEHTMRKALFKQRLAAVHLHNAQPGRLWKAAPSKFSDRSDAERKVVRGLKKRGAPRPAGSLLQSSQTLQQKELPEVKSYMHLSVANTIPDQGECGSCWAIAATSVLEAHYELYSAKGGSTRSFSPQQMLECTPNPYECGGQGGCQGATVELGMNYTVSRGLATNDDVPYLGTDGACKANAEKDVDTLRLHGGAAFGLISFETLPSNVDRPLAEAVAEFGPVAVSASAGSWYEYQGGVFDGCEKDSVVDHAITLYGYGKDKDAGVKYWLIRNSWGPAWGEKGFIRLLRHDATKRHCGTDSSPLEGLGCKSGPNKAPDSVEICGMCGILYDSVVPYFLGSKKHPHPVSAEASSTETDKQLVEEAPLEDDVGQPRSAKVEAGKKADDDDDDDDQQEKESDSEPEHVPSPEEMQEEEDEAEIKEANLNRRTERLVISDRLKVADVPRSSLAVSAAAALVESPTHKHVLEAEVAMKEDVKEIKDDEKEIYEDEQAEEDKTASAEMKKANETIIDEDEISIKENEAVIKKDEDKFKPAVAVNDTKIKEDEAEIKKEEAHIKKMEDQITKDEMKSAAAALVEAPTNKQLVAEDTPRSVSKAKAGKKADDDDDDDQQDSESDSEPEHVPSPEEMQEEEDEAEIKEANLNRRTERLVIDDRLTVGDVPRSSLAVSAAAPPALMRVEARRH